MGAIAKTALGGKFGDLGKQVAYARGQIGHMQGAHAGGIYDPGTAGNGVQRARCCGVAALGIGLADAAGSLGGVMVGADEGVQQGRFADAGRADQRHGVTGFAPWGEGLHSIGRFGVQRNGDQIALQRLSLRNIFRRIGDGIGLGQHNDRVNLRLVYQCQIPLQPCRVEIGIAGGDDEQRIDVRGNQLRGVAALDPAFQQRLGGQTTVQGMSFGTSQHPVAHREIGGFGVDGQVEADRVGTEIGGQARSVNGGYAHGRKGGIIRVQLIGEECGPALAVLVGRDDLGICHFGGQRPGVLHIGVSSKFG